MLYSWLLALHLIAVMIFIAGLLATGIVLASASMAGAPQRPLIDALLRWDRRVTGPALLALWALGLALATTSGWFTSPWLQAKLLIVLLLSAIHGMQSGRLRRLDAEDLRPGNHCRLPVVVMLAVVAIILLAVFKPGV